MINLTEDQLATLRTIVEVELKFWQGSKGSEWLRRVREVHQLLQAADSIRVA